MLNWLEMPQLRRWRCTARRTVSLRQHDAGHFDALDPGVPGDPVAASTPPDAAVNARAAFRLGAPDHHVWWLMDTFRLVHARYKNDTDARRVPPREAQHNRQIARAHLRLMLRDDVEEALADREATVLADRYARVCKLREQWAREDATRRAARDATIEAIMRGPR